jgi:hypothetical protein
MKFSLAKLSVSSNRALVISCILVGINSPSFSQDYKPGDPINFGAAHKPMFGGDAGSSRGINFAAPQTPAVTTPISPIPDAAAATGAQAVPNNFLNTRSIPWKPGDPVTLGSAHRPYTPEEDKPPVSSPTSSAAAPPLVPITPVSSMPPSPTPADGDLREAPTAGSMPTAPTAARQAPVAQNTPPAAATAQRPTKTKSHPKQNAANSNDSGNFFSRAFHWIFGGGK